MTKNLRHLPAALQTTFCLLLCRWLFEKGAGMEIRKDSWHYKLYSSVYWLFDTEPPESTNLCGYMRMLILGAPIVWLVVAPLWSILLFVFSVIFWIYILSFEAITILFCGKYWPIQKDNKGYYEPTGFNLLWSVLLPSGRLGGAGLPSPLVVKIAGWRLPPVVFMVSIVAVFLALSSLVALWIIVSLIGVVTTGVLTILLIRRVRKSQSLQPFFTYLKDKKNGICRQVVFTDIKNPK